MYKIYINEVQCLLIATSDLHLLPEATAEHTLCALYPGKVKHLLNYIDMCEKNPKFNCVVIHFEDFNLLRNDFTSIFKNQEAAGGLVENENGEFLFIFRRGCWDLPKGKIEKNESIEDAAIREVTEETGVTDLLINHFIGTTLHAFKSKKENRIIKTSHWFLMKSLCQELIPQTEEDIEKAVWMSMIDFKNNCQPVYKNIMDVLDLYQVQ